jgi:MoaA/NifB/PqqE/SkfB family radical SAM enzyme
VVFSFFLLVLLLCRRDLDNISPTIPAGEQESAKAKLTPEQSRDVEAKLANIIGKYGERLSEEQREHLRRILAYNETLLAPIRAFALQNGDPPVTVSKLSSGENID